MSNVIKPTGYDAITVPALLALQAMPYQMKLATDNAGTDLPWLEDRAYAMVNTHWNQMEQGLILEQYYGIPGKIWTPWGVWGCWGSGSGFDMDRLLLDNPNLKVAVHKEAVTSEQGVHGPTYFVTEVNGIKQPEPLVRQRAHFIDAKRCLEHWRQLVLKLPPSPGYSD